MDYPVTISESFSFTNTNVFGFQELLTQNFNIIDSLIGKNRTNAVVSENYSIQDTVNAGKLISIIIEDNYNISNTVSTNAEYLQKISENYNINSFISSYKEVNGSLELDETLDCWVVNYETNAFSRYSNFSFNSFAKLNDKYYGVNDLGLFRLEGNLDDTKEIQSRILTGKIDVSGLGSMSYVRDIILYQKSDGTLRLNVKANDGKVETYRILNQSDDIVSSRIVLSKGRKAIFWQFELTNDEQTDFELEQMKVYRVITAQIT